VPPLAAPVVNRADNLQNSTVCLSSILRREAGCPADIQVEYIFGLFAQVNETNAHLQNTFLLPVPISGKLQSLAIQDNIVSLSNIVDFTYFKQVSVVDGSGSAELSVLAEHHPSYTARRLVRL
jgi:hypothetical protein